MKNETENQNSSHDEIVAAISDSKFAPFRPSDPNAPTNPSVTLHTTAVRENVLSWLDTSEARAILEIGSGYGALSEYLCREHADAAVHVYQPNSDQANAISKRLSRFTNVSILAEKNVSDIPSDGSYDLVVVNTAECPREVNSIRELVAEAKRLVSDDGRVVVIAQNSLGISYLNGLRDRNGELMNTINGASYHELLDIAKGHFEHASMFYAMADHDFVSTIYSDRYKPGYQIGLTSAGLPASRLDHGREQLSDELRLGLELQRNKMFEHHTNGLILVASNARLTNDVAFAQFQNYRPDESRLMTTVRTRDDGSLFIRKVSSKASRPQLDLIEESYAQIASNETIMSAVTVAKPERPDVDTIEFSFVDGDNLEGSLLEGLVNRDVDSVVNTLQKFLGLMGSMSTKGQAETSDEFKKVFGDSYTESESWIPLLMDLNFDNFIYDNDDHPHLIDYEWMFEFNFPSEYVIGRTFYWEVVRRFGALFDSLPRHNDETQTLCGVTLPRKVAEVVAPYLDGESFTRMLDTEEMFQAHATGGSPKLPDSYAPAPVVELDEVLKGYGQLRSDVDELRAAADERLARIKELEQELSERDGQLDGLRSSRVVRAVEKRKKN